MSDAPAETNHRKLPSKRQAIVFRLKSFLLQSRRFVDDRVGARKTSRFSRGNSFSALPVAAVSDTKIWTVTDPQERFLNAGKIHNLRLAIKQIDGLEIPAGETFSFWKHIGRITRRRGFVAGRELREGCIIPNIGGGLCQLSNALYNAALDANFEIVERHPHTQAIPGSHAVYGRDATVFWNYIDLRFRASVPYRIEAKLSADELNVRFRADSSAPRKLHPILREKAAKDINNCASCGEKDCFRSVKAMSPVTFGKTAFLVDEYSPEFDAYLQATRTQADVMLMPVDGKRFRKANYAWTRDGFASTPQSLKVTALRSYKSRRLASQGAARQRNLLAMYERLADDYAAKLTYDCLHLVVDQRLLPHLWRKGHLGGRTFDVLAASLPMAEIQRRLDEAFVLHPESKTLADFRADRLLVTAEEEALGHARKIITAHTAIEALFGDRGHRIEWTSPTAANVGSVRAGRPCILFPASTLGRKGCYELRDAIRGLDVDLMTAGPFIEGKDFWSGINLASEDSRPDVVVLPAFVEHSPRRLLRFAAADIPVIASTACGLDGVDGVETIEAGRPEMLRRAIVKSLGL